MSEENKKYNNELNKKCPFNGFTTCRTDCACISWDSVDEAWICNHNSLEIVVYKKQKQSY